MNKVAKLEDILLIHSRDVVCITETWLHGDIHDSEIVPPSYSLKRTDRWSCNSTGGGVAIAVCKGLSFDKEQGIPDHESVWCTVYAHESPVLIGGIYRKPNASDEYITKIHDFLHGKLKDRTKPILAGDFNLPTIDWNTLTAGSRDVSSSELLLNVAFSFSLSQLVTEPTRIQGHTLSILDLAFISNHLTADVTLEEGISDHKLVLLTITIGHSVPVPKSRVAVKNYNRADDVSIIDYLEVALETFSIDNHHTVNNLWLKLKDIIKYCEETFVPTRLKRTKRRNPWITRGVIHLKRRLQRMRKKKHNPDDIRRLSDELKASIRNARDIFFSTTLANFVTQHPQKFWRYLSKPADHVTQIDTNGTITDEALTIANTFNRYFQSVFTRTSASAESKTVLDSALSMSELVITHDGILVATD